MRAKKIKAVGLLVWIFMSRVTFANTVRTVLVNNESMSPIYLKMGKSTVLRFVEKPKKVVVGNQNYYGLEFIESDVAIQPIGAVATNLFVYSEHHTYGFLLTPGERYDDLVFVRWKYPGMEIAKPQKAKTTVAVNLNLIFKIGDGLKITVDRIQGPSAFGLHLIDCTIENIGKSDLTTSDLALQAMRGGKALPSQNTVIENDKLKAHEKTKARIILKLETKDDVWIEGHQGQLSGKALISHKRL